MRKILIVLAIVLGVQFSYAQKSAYNELPNRLFTQGQEMFLNKNYVGCVNSLHEFKKTAKDAQLIAEADYLIVSSLFYQGTPGIVNDLKNYVEKYPETYHRNQVNFFIGTIHFQAKEWDKALYWLAEADLDYLTEGEQEDYSYRIAYSCLQAGKNEEAKRLFGLLMRNNSKKYSEPASYYYAYIDFQEGNYKQAANVFRKLKDKPAYKENVTFYLMQGAYLEGNLQETINEGKNYIASYPRSTNSTEVYRLLGSSYYKTGDLVNSVLNYERYLQGTPTPFREDMYQLADAYYQNNTYKQAIEALKHVASTTDEMGQAGYFLLGQCYLKTNSDANALMAFESASRSKFNRTISEDALYNYVLLINKGSVSAFNQSIDAFQRFLTEYPNSKYTSEINGLMATTLLSTKNYSAALDAISKIKSPDRQILEAKQMILAQLGIQEFINGNYNEAMNNFNAGIKMGDYNRAARNEAYFWRGETTYRQGDYRGAIEDYNNYISNSSASQANYALALYNLGYSHFQLKNYSQALSNFKRYTSTEKDKRNTTYADALNRIGDCYLYNRNFAEAEQSYTQAVSSSPASADYAEYQKAFVKGLQRDYRGKVSGLDNMMSKYPNSEYYDDALLEKGKALVMLNREADAIPALTKLLNEFPKSTLAPQAGVQLGQLYFNTNNSHKAIDAYKKVISDYPNTEEARLSVQSLEGVYKDINDIGAYATYMNSLGGNYKVSSLRQDSLTYLAAEALYLKNKGAQAKTALDKYIQSYPRGIFNGEAHFNLGLIAFEAKDFNAALPHFRGAIEANNSKYLDDALIYASGIEFDKKDYAAAYSTYEHLSQAASSTDNKGIGELGMLRCAYLTHKDSEVVAAAGKLLANNKTSTNIANEARFHRGKSLNNLGRTTEAIEDFKEVAKDTRNVFGAESQFLIAESYYNSKAYDNAEKQVSDFMKKGTPHEYWMARAIIVLSDAHAAKGDNFMARQYLESMQANYKGKEADIKEMVKDRLTALEGK